MTKVDSSKEASFRVQRRSLKDEEFLRIVMEACHNFEGDTSILELAIGAFAWGRVVGYDGLRMMHTWRTLRRFDEILGVSVRSILPATTLHSDRLRGIKLAKQFGSVWRSLAGGLVPVQEAKIAEKG